ncbi:MAG: hypothetical protein U0792_12060 [Gemmataceae bacterium]
MSFPLACQACGARLKLPPGCTKKKARCPKCNARINLTEALNATAYQPDSVASRAEFTVPERPVSLGIPAKPSKPSNPPGSSSPDASDLDPATTVTTPTVAEREEDPLPYPDLSPTAKPAVRPLPPVAPSTEPPLTLDDDPLPLDDGKPIPPAAPPPFRAPAHVNHDSAGLFAGPCEVVVVSHGLFLESVPYRPFLYAPIGSAAYASGRELSLSLPDRTISVELHGPEARQIVADADAFLARERPMLDWREYRRRPLWLLGIALIFAVGLAVGPRVMSQTTGVDEKTSFRIAVGFAGIGLLANLAVVLLTRLSVPGKVAVMATIAGAITGVFLLTTVAYIAGRNRGVEQPRMPEPGPWIPPPKPPGPIPESPPTPPRKMLPTALDAARKEGLFQFEDGPDDVTALAVTPDNAVMMVGYKNGTTRVWPFDHITVDSFAPGPQADGPISHIQFDSSGAVSYLRCPGGTIAAFWNDPPEIPLKIPGDPFAVFSFPGEERFAVVRGDTIAVRGVSPRVFLEPPKGVNGVAVLPSAPKLETTFNPPGRPQLLAWHPTGTLVAALPDGTITLWSEAGRRPDSTIRDHKATVRAAGPIAIQW